ncbi:Rieske (2Fe-2S) protein [Marinagarivorans algicola]|uniref:Rieske (2Fe-2S) protein n=1 Tax=Marinagarivorans algicola TaxID=1513270 RepID=UPI001FD0C97A|nr:Rieske (2Fe-2S) protein [Marinagarivorans algicola]
MRTLCTIAHFEQFAEPQTTHNDNPASNSQTLGVNMDGEHYIVVRQAHIFTAFINRCPHLHIPLEWQAHHFLDPDTELLRCSTHGALFIPSSGECVSGPCAGDTLQSVNIQRIADTLVLEDQAST